MDFLRCSNCKCEKQHDNYATYIRNSMQHYRLTCKQCLVCIYDLQETYIH